MSRHAKPHQPPEATPAAAASYMPGAQELRRSGAAGVHADRRRRRLRRRGPAQRAAITANEREGA
jgi:hypothetical protein